MKFSGPLLIALCCALWATDTLVRVPLLGHIDGSSLVLLEHVVALVAMFPFFLKNAKDLKKMSARNWAAIAFIGMVGSALATLCLTLSYGLINPSVAILLQKLQPIIAIAGARIILGERPNLPFYAIASFAILGAVLLSAPELSTMNSSALDGSDRFFKGVSLALVASAAWGLSTVFGRYLSDQISRETTTWLRFAFGLFGLMIIRALGGSPILPSTVQFDSTVVAGCLYVGLISGVLAMNLYYAGLAKTTASIAAISELSFPLLSILLNWLVLGKSLQALQLIGAALLITAVMIISLAKKLDRDNPHPA